MLAERCSTFKLGASTVVYAPAQNYLHVWSAPGYTDNSLLWAWNVRPLKWICAQALPNAE
jgi:hypothetical protein